MERKYSIDLARIIVSMCIVIIHTVSIVYFEIASIGYSNWLLASSAGWLVSWSTLVFVMISGYLLLNDAKINILSFYKRRFGKLLLPWVGWNVVYWQFMNHGSFNEFVVRTFTVGNWSHLYFLNIMIGLYLITPFINSWLRSEYLVRIAYILILVSVSYKLGVVFFNWPKLENVLTWFVLYLGFYIFGYLVKTKKIFFEKKWLLLSAFGLIVSILITKELVFKFESHDLDTVLVSRLSPVVVMCSMVIFYFLENIDNSKLNRFRKFLSISNSTFGIFLIHPFVLHYLPKYYAENFWIWFVLTIFLTYGLSLAFVRFGDWFYSNYMKPVLVKRFDKQSVDN